MAPKFDFSGWATKNDLLCADGRIIRRDAFKDNDGQTVPLVYQHQHTDPMNILGHALLENREEGVYAYCSFNDTPTAQHVKSAVEHGDVCSLSIYANKLVQKGKDVLHGAIREVSIVLAGANPGAYIDNPIIVHGEGTENESYEDDLTEGIIYHEFDGEGDISLYHAEPEKKEEDVEEKKEEEKPAEAEKKEPEAEAKEESKEETKMADAPAKEKTVQDVFDELTEEQKKVVYFMIGQALEDAKGDADDTDDEDEGETKMKHNVFENEAAYGPVLSHADEIDIINNAKKFGTLKDAIAAFAEENELSHDDLAPVSGATSYPSGTTPAGVDSLFPEFRDVRPGAPEIVANDQAWVKAVLNGVHKTPFSRIRTAQVDIRAIEELRAKGYQKGTEKLLAGNYAVAKRATAPQTVYVKSALNRDDIVDITDFDYVDYQYKIDRMMLEKELAQAILIGDGRDAAAADKINPENIRPIWGDSNVFTITKVISATAGENDPGFGAGYLYASALEEALLDAKIDYHGSGAMDMFCAQAFYNKVFLAKDLNGRRLYNNAGELKAALDVNNVYAVPEFANLTRTVGEGTSATTYKLLAIFVNLGDYALGATKGGEITHFTDFDIDFNQHKSLLETRVSGANTRVLSAICIEEEVVGG